MKDLPAETADERRSWFLAILLLAALGTTAGAAQALGPLPRQAVRLATARAHLAEGEIQRAHDAFMDLVAHATTSHEDFHIGLSSAARLDIDASKTTEAREHLDALDDVLGLIENPQRLALETRLAIQEGEHTAIVDALQRYQALAQGRGDMEVMELAQARLVASGQGRVVVELYTSLLAHADLSTNTLEIATLQLMRWPGHDHLEERRKLVFRPPSSWRGHDHLEERRKLVESLLARGLSEPLSARAQRWLADR